MELGTVVTIWLAGVPIMGAVAYHIVDEKNRNSTEEIFTMCAFGWLWPFVIAFAFPFMIILLRKSIRAAAAPADNGGDDD